MRRCVGCGCPLSRYNGDAHCGTCRRLAWGAQPSVPAHVWESPEVRSALGERDFGAVCLLVRRLGALRQDDVATLTGLSQAFLSMLESGMRRLTNIDKIVMLLEGLDVPIELTGPILRGPKAPATGERAGRTAGGSVARRRAAATSLPGCGSCGSSGATGAAGSLEASRPAGRRRRPR